MSVRQKRYLDWLASQPCASCGGGPVEIAHVLGAVSPKTGLKLGRRQGIGAVFALPLCPACHRTSPTSIHNVGEDAWGIERGGSAFVTELAGSYLARFVLGQ